MYIWQNNDWPHFRWNETVLAPRLDTVRLEQGRLLGRAEAAPKESDDLSMEMDALIQNAIRTSEIEDEHLDFSSVRSSVARQLGLNRAGIADRSTAKSEALVAVLLEATRQPDQALTCEQLCRWQSMLFQGDTDSLTKIRIGELRGEQTMRVVSGRIDRPRVHFEAPPKDRLKEELKTFLKWFNHPPAGLDPVLRAGIAHIWLITLHPFDDGNGRVARAVTDRALAQAERRSVRLYSLSAAIMAQRKEYYSNLERTQKGDLDITEWLAWFVEILQKALQDALTRIAQILDKTRFWQLHATTMLKERQIKVLNRLLDSEGKEFGNGINARKYRSIAKVSKATATRDLTDLLHKGCLRKLPGGGRNTRYAIATDKTGNITE